MISQPQSRDSSAPPASTYKRVCACVCLQCTLNEPRQCAACSTLLPWLRSTRSPERALLTHRTFAIKTISRDKCFHNNAAFWRSVAFQHPEPHALTSLSGTAAKPDMWLKLKNTRSPATWIPFKCVPDTRRPNGTKLNFTLIFHRNRPGSISNDLTFNFGFSLVGRSRRSKQFFRQAEKPADRWRNNYQRKKKKEM